MQYSHRRRGRRPACFRFFCDEQAFGNPEWWYYKSLGTRCTLSHTSQCKRCFVRPKDDACASASQDARLCYCKLWAQRPAKVITYVQLLQCQNQWSKSLQSTRCSCSCREERPRYVQQCSATPARCVWLVCLIASTVCECRRWRVTTPAIWRKSFRCGIKGCR